MPGPKKQTANKKSSPTKSGPSPRKRNTKLKAKSPKKPAKGKSKNSIKEYEIAMEFRGTAEEARSHFKFVLESKKLSKAEQVVSYIAK